MELSITTTRSCPLRRINALAIVLVCFFSATVLAKQTPEQKEEIIGIFAKSVAAGGGAAAQAKDELQKLFTGTPEEMNALIAAKKAEL